MKLFKNLYDYRELLKTNVKKDIRGKYKGSFLYKSLLTNSKNLFINSSFLFKSLKILIFNYIDFNQ